MPGALGRSALTLLVAGLMFARAPARAAEEPKKPEPAQLTLAVGGFDVLRDDPTVEGRVEYGFPAKLWIFRPFVGGLATAEGSGMLYGGLQLQLYWGRRITAVGSVAPGAYLEGSGRDLGGVFEVRSAIELAWRFDNGARLGLQFAHTSNASTGDINPGAESLSLAYTLPLGR